MKTEIKLCNFNFTLKTELSSEHDPDKSYVENWDPLPS